VPTGWPTYRLERDLSFAPCRQQPGRPRANSPPISTRRSNAVLGASVGRLTLLLAGHAKRAVRVDDTTRAFAASPASRRPDRGLSAIH